jgi:hypothetical protein
MAWRNLLRRWRSLAAGVVALGALAGPNAGEAGCGCGCGWWAHWRELCQPATCPAVTGTYTRQLFDLQAAKAEADDFVIYKNEWYMGGTKLGPFGSYHITEIVRRLAEVPFPVVLQPQIGDPALDLARRDVVVRALAEAGMPDADQRVIIAYPQAEGLYADIQAQRAYLFMMLPGIYSFRLLYGGGYGLGLFGGGLYGAGLYGGGFGLGGLGGGLYGGGGIFGGFGTWGGW